jgi:hypothetical protein
MNADERRFTHLRIEFFLIGVHLRSSAVPLFYCRDILAGRRSLSKAHIKTLAAHFNVEPGLFL